MSATTPSSSLLPLVEFDRTGSSPFLATQFEDTKAQMRDTTVLIEMVKLLRRISRPGGKFFKG